MGVTDTLRGSGFTPTTNKDEDFPAIKGNYKAQWKRLRPGFDKDDKTKKNRYEVAFQIQETLEGDLADGRYLNYTVWLEGQYTTQEKIEKGIKRICNDAFTAGVTLDTSSDEAFEGSFEQVVDKEVFIRAYHFKGAKDAKGNPIPEAEQKDIQMFVVKLEKDMKLGKDGKTPSRPDNTPF